MEILVHVSAPSRAPDDARYRAQVAAILAQSTDTRDSPTQSAVHAVSVARQDSPCGLPRSDQRATPAIPLPESATPQPIATEIDSSQTVPLELVRRPVLDSLDSLVSVIPESLPDRYQASHPEADSFLGDLDSPGENHPLKKRRVDGPCEEHGLAMSSTTPRAIIVSNVPPHPDNDYASPNPIHTLPPTVLSKPPHLLYLPPLPLEIRPPPPPISTIPFTSHITPTLSMLMERLKPTRTYRPMYQTRSLDPLERGYWAVNINIWLQNQIGQDTDLENRPGPTSDPDPEPELHANVDGPSETDQSRDWGIMSFNRFWSFLSNFVGKDARAGWGVWCYLEHAPSRESLPTATSEKVVIGRSVPVLLKVYAWGEIAMHTYLLLFLASERRVRKMGPQWRDSTDAVVIQMP